MVLSEIMMVCIGRSLVYHFTKNTSHVRHLPFRCLLQEMDSGPAAKSLSLKL